MSANKKRPAERVRELVDGAAEYAPPAAAANEVQQVHPLARFIEYGGTPTPPRWVIPGLIAEGIVLIAGAGGVGKTTAMLPLAAVAAGLHAGDDPLAPKEWRHVIYVSEDTDQADRVLQGLVGHADLGVGWDDVRERVHLVAAQRMSAPEVAKVAPVYAAAHTRHVRGVEIAPLVVLDTRNAVFAMDDENDNAAASAVVATLKQQFGSLPVWIIGHIAKGDLSRQEAKAMSARGAGAWGDDVSQTIFVIRDASDQRFIVLGKTRFVPKWNELQIDSRCASVLGRDQFGDIEPVTLRWGIARPTEESREQARERAQAEADQAEANALRAEVLDAVSAAWQEGLPLNRGGVKARVRRRQEATAQCVELLLAEQWLAEIEVPKAIRAHNSRGRFLVRLDAQEREALLAGHGLPQAKRTPPPSWCRPQESPVPDCATDLGTGGDLEAA